MLAHDKTIDSRMTRGWHQDDTTPSRDADQYNLQSIVKIAAVNHIFEPDPATRLASISRHKTPEFCPIKYHSTEVVNFVHFFCPLQKGKWTLRFREITVAVRLAHVV